MRTTLRNSFSATAALLLVLGLAACSSGGDGTATGTTDGTDSAATDTSTEDTGRVFDSTDDAVITALETTFEDKNGRAEWQGSTIRLTLDGTVTAPTKYIPCSAAEALLADGEDAIVIYPDGELICADRPQ